MSTNTLYSVVYCASLRWVVQQAHDRGWFQYLKIALSHELRTPGITHFIVKEILVQIECECEKRKERLP